MRGHWAGIPMPLQDQPLVIEPRFPGAWQLMGIGEKPDDDHGGSTIRNRFYSAKMRCDLYIWNEGESIGGENPPVKWGWVPAVHGADKFVNTLGASFAWGLEQEGNAVHTLGRLIRHHQFKMYLLTGAFMETSKRSGLTYIFRKLRPTIVLDNRIGGIDYNFGEFSATKHEGSRIRCCLCMHPIAYYSNSWGGAMCPTDDVIAHLMLMRGDEPMLWRRSNQHSPARPEAGL